jgi:hypothetical protein
MYSMAVRFLLSTIDHSHGPLETMLIGIAFGELIAFTLSFALSDELCNCGTKLVVTISKVLVVPMSVAGTLALMPELIWESRGLVLCAGVIATILQLIFELYQNKRPLFRI